jgi:hypothetical protein
LFQRQRAGAYPDGSKRARATGIKGGKMSNEIFLFVLAASSAALFYWAFRALPKERWQIMAVVPVAKDYHGEWRGLNLTYYGFFQATSNALAVAMVFVLLGATGVAAKTAFLLTGIVFAVCWPAAKPITRVVEKKRHLFTVGGAVFAGGLVLPWVIEILNWGPTSAVGSKIPVVPALAAVSIAYAYGEGIGRLACISFGCCYGRRLNQLSPRVRRLFLSFNFRFTGLMKKAVYEGCLEGVQIAPVQAITSVVFVLTGLVGTALFLDSRFAAAMLVTVTVTQTWRFASERLRVQAGSQSPRFSVYQIMALSLVAYAGVLALCFPVEQVRAVSIGDGLEVIWNPSVLLFCQLVWVVVFLITGRSGVTGSRLSFFVHHDRIRAQD